MIKKKYDLIISNFFLFLTDKYDYILKKILFSLAPNGFFIATLPTEDNFKALKLAMIKTDMELYGGAFNRFNHYLELTKIIDLLKKNDFKIPLVNLENINLEYYKFEKLLHDIRSMNLSYYNQDKKQILEKNFILKNWRIIIKKT